MMYQYSLFSAFLFDRICLVTALIDVLIFFIKLIVWLVVVLVLATWPGSLGAYAVVCCLILKQTFYYIISLLL